LTLWVNDQDRGDVEKLKQEGVNVIAYRMPRLQSLLNCLQALLTSQPLQAVYSWQPDLAKELQRQINTVGGASEFDVMHVEHLLIWEARPDVKLNIVGKDPSRELLSLSANTRIHLSGEVPDIRPYLKSATVAVAPITYGAGIQNNVLESLACATPTVVTAHAISALKVQPKGEYW
jgi:glycosyltransferase involved in cell wall biosynthesis